VKKPLNPRWFIVLVMFLFMLLHQTDMLMINSMLKPIMDEFGINESQMGLHTSILVICMVSWAFCTLFLIGAVYVIPKDIQTLRQPMRERAQSLAAGTAPGRPAAGQPPPGGNTPAARGVLLDIHVSIQEVNMSARRVFNLILISVCFLLFTGCAASAAYRGAAVDGFLADKDFNQPGAVGEVPPGEGGLQPLPTSGAPGNGPRKKARVR
jgi:hypothetical protein